MRQNILYTTGAIVAVCTCAVLLLTGCQAGMREIKDIKESISTNIDKIDWPDMSLGKSDKDEDASDDAEDNAIKIVNVDGSRACPKVIVSDELSYLSEFTDPLGPSSETLVSEVWLSKNRGSCAYNEDDNSVTVQLSLLFDGRLGPRSRIYKGDKPNFAYPYFVAVVSPAGEIVAKEIFAATISYGASQKTVQHKETLRQVIPLDTVSHGKKYKILAGFQLTEEQLLYNRENLKTESGPALTNPQ